MPTVLIHYHEIALKRGNRPLFLHHLARNLEGATQDLGSAHEAEGPGPAAEGDASLHRGATDASQDERLPGERVRGRSEG